MGKWGENNQWGDREINNCSEKNETIVKYSVLNKNKQMFASRYKLYLPTEEELARELRHEMETISGEKNLH
ncbi:MAG: DUF1016 family protein [Nitrospiraceae bacterium]|nr:MAG: DUF1016 family protein [Nitrospiraceae bacterium]